MLLADDDDNADCFLSLGEGYNLILVMEDVFAAVGDDDCICCVSTLNRSRMSCSFSTYC